MRAIIQFAVMTAVFAILGAVAYGLSKLLRCEALLPILPNAKQSTGYGLLAVTISVSIMILITIVASNLKGPMLGEDIEVYKFKHLLPQGLFLAIAVVPAIVVMIVRREPLSTVGITSQNLWRALAIGLILALSTFYFQPGGFLGKITKLQSHHAIAFVFYAFIGLSEEFLYRGFLQTRLVCWFGGVTGWILTAIVFAYVHIAHRMLIGGMSFTDSFLACSSLIPVALLLGFIMLRTGNLVTPLIFHIFVNWVGIIK